MVGAASSAGLTAREGSQDQRVSCPRTKHRARERNILQNNRLNSLRNTSWKVMRSVGVSGTGTFRAIATIDAPLEICASYELMKMTRERLEMHYKDGVGLRREVVELNPHSDLFYLVVNVGPRLLQHREIFTRSIWKYFDNDPNSFAVGYVDAEDDRFPPLKNHVRAYPEHVLPHELCKLPKNLVRLDFLRGRRGEGEGGERARAMRHGVAWSRC